MDGGSAGDRAEEEWAEAQRLWEALQQEQYNYQERQWKDGQEKKLEWEEQRLRALQQQQAQHKEVLDDVRRASANHAAHIQYQNEQAASAAAAGAAFNKVQKEHVARQQREQEANKKISEEKLPPRQVEEEDTAQHGFGVDNAPLGQLAQGGAAQRDQFVRDFKADMRRHKLRSVREIMVRAMWLQSQADFADAEASTPEAEDEFGGAVGVGGAEQTAGRASAQFGRLARVEKAWHAKRALWQGLWQHERDMNAEQRSIDVLLARALAQVHPSKDGGDARLKAARLQSLYLESDASPDRGMLRAYWKVFCVCSF